MVLASKIAEQEVKIDLVVIDADFRRRKMFVGFAKKLARKAVDGESVRELDDLVQDWQSPRLAIVSEIADSRADLIDALRRRNPDICIYFVIGEKAPLEGEVSSLPTGTLLQRAPVGFAQFEIMIQNGDLIHRRSQERHERNLSWLQELNKLNESMLLDRDAKVAHELKRIWDFACQSLQSKGLCSSFVVLERENDITWRIAHAHGAPAFVVGRSLFDEGDLKLFERAQEAIVLRAGQFKSSIAEFSKMTQQHLLLISQALPTQRSHQLWLFSRTQTERPFLEWEVRRINEFCLMLRLAIEGNLALAHALKRLQHFMHIYEHARYGRGADDILQGWATDAAGALGATAFALHTEGMANIKVGPTSGSVDKKLLTDLNAKAQFLQVGQIEIVGDYDQENHEGQGMLIVLAEGRAPVWWYYAHIPGPISRIEKSILTHARTYLLAILQRRIVAERGE